jgi:sortase A
MRRTIYRILAIITLIAAAATFTYPYWTRWYAGEMQGVVMQQHADVSGLLSAAQREALFNEAVRYNEQMAHGRLADDEGLYVNDPFSVLNEELSAQYADQLRVSEDGGPMAMIDLPSIGIRLPIYHGVDERVLNLGIGHVPQSALPVGGRGTHSVLAGHRGHRALLFTDLDKLQVKEQFFIQVLDHTLAYEIERIDVVEPEDVSLLAPQADRDLVTLATCTPLGVNSHRLLITGHRVAYVEPVTQWPDANTRQLLVAAIIVALALALSALLWWDHRRRV